MSDVASISPPIRLHLLGGFLLRYRGEDMAVPDSARRLLALLGLREAALARDYVSGVLWPDTSERHARASLRTTVWRLHKLCPTLLTATAGELELASHVTVDVRELASQARRLGNPNAAEDLRLDWTPRSGDLLPGWYDEWILLERERIRQLYLHALHATAEALAARGRFGPALEAALQALQVDPLRESAHRLVVQVHLAEGNVTEARRHYHMCRQLLWRELRVPPSQSLRDIEPALHVGPTSAAARHDGGL